MNLLVLDTSTHRATVALLAGASRHDAPPDPSAGARHGRELLPMIATLCRRAGLRPADLDAIGVGLGPGSYTGLRIGVTAAKTLAYTRQAPLVGIDTFAAIARNAPAEALVVHVVADAQRGGVYVARFERPGSAAVPACVVPLRVEPMAEWATNLRPGEWVLGPALDRLRIDWPVGVHRGTSEQGHPSGASLVDLARAALDSGERADPATLEPVYLRRSAAEEQWDRRT